MATRACCTLKCLIFVPTCSDLKVLDIGNNAFNDAFPDWLESLPLLHVLVLRGNKFHGSIRSTDPVFAFDELRIMDQSHNEFAGALPTQLFDRFKEMKMDTRDLELSYMADKIDDYEGSDCDSVRVTMKGFESLKGLDLSQNMLTGILPHSLGNLTNLEWLDLSSNELVRKIHVELADIPWLSNLNLSYNRLEGPIPNGKQFDTFFHESFEGNFNLCGFPLSKWCGRDTKPPEPSLENDDDDDDSSKMTNGFNWRIVMMGYACGLVIGISIGYMLLYSNGKLHWLSDTILEEIEYRRETRPKTRNARRSLKR